MKTIFLLFALFATVTQMRAQTVLASAGNSYASPSVSVNWTVGETIIETFDTNNALVTQGMHQQSALPSSVSEVQANALTLWPNPAREQVTISGSRQPIEHIEIFDAVGKLVASHAQKNVFNVAPLSAGSYVVRVRSGSLHEEHRLVVMD
jgi:hypothetical protein